MSNLFISYSRRDRHHAQVLVDALKARRRHAWIDVEGIRPAEDFMASIHAAIEAADAVAFLISPDSVVSRVCRRELRHALVHGKRVIPVLCRPALKLLIPSALRLRNWIDFVDTAKADQAVSALLEAMDTDLDWVRLHRQLLQRALDWDHMGRPADLLLPRPMLTGVDAAVVNAEGSAPRLGALQLAFIAASRSAPWRDDLTYRLAGELDAAARLQRESWTSPDALLAGEDRVSVAAWTQAAGPVGGDFYELIRLGADRLFVVVGDVAGKGVAAAMQMAAAKGICRSLLLQGVDRLPALMEALNAAIRADQADGTFLTLFTCILDLRSGELVSCDAGAQTPLRLARGTAAALDGHGGPPVGVIDSFDYAQARTSLAPGETLVLCTDGVTEALAPDGTLFGIERLQTAISHEAGDVRAIGERILLALRTFSGGAQPVDDETLVVVRWNGPTTR